MLDVIDILAAAGGSSSGATVRGPRAAALLSTSLTGSRDHPIVHLTGELDMAGRSALLAICTSAAHRELVVDLTDLTFMDCAGYGTLVSARLVLSARDGSLVLTGVHGQPRRLLSLIRATERAVGSLR